MSFNRMHSVKSAVLAASLFAALSGAASAASGPSGPHVGLAVQGNIGEVIVNPFKIAPLTAIVKNGGYVVTNAKVKVLAKENGRDIAYPVADTVVKTYAGIPIFGLYPDHLNTVEVEYDRTYNGKTEHFKDRYQFYTAPVFTLSSGMPAQRSTMYNAEPVKVDKEFEDRLYLVDNQLMPMAPQGGRFVWNNPAGGALEWCFNSQIAIIDTKGDVRWYLLNDLINDQTDPWRSGFMMGFQQNPDGALSWGFGQRYVKYDLMGREIFNRQLPPGYNDFSHAFDNAQNGHFLLRVGSSDYRRPDGKRVRTVRDVILEVDRDGNVVDDFRLFEILDPYRKNLLEALDQGAVCLNIDASKSGQTMSAEELAKLEESDAFGDIVGTGAGRNWAHVNSVDYDPTDDSIIISSRHQGIAKISRDKTVKWILASPEGWQKDLAAKVLTPVDKSGTPIKCEGSVCEGGFDWSWTQHTAWRIDEKSEPGIVYLTVFDNGDARGMEQPAMPEMKYTRGVVYKVDEKKMTVEQVWEVGKDLGFEYYSPVTGLCQYQPDKDSVVVYYSTAGMGDIARSAGRKQGRIHPVITEYRWGETKPAVEIRLWDTMGYQAFPIHIEKAFSVERK